MALATIEAELSRLKNQYQMDSGKLELLQKQLNNKTVELDQTRQAIKTGQMVKVILGKMAEFARERMIYLIKGTVTWALKAILIREDMTFDIETWFSNDGKPNARWMISTKHGEVMVETEPEDGNGGGVTDVVSLALRAALLEQSQPKPGGLFALDEPAKMVSKEYLSNLAEFFKRYLEQTGRQGLIITHHDILAECADVGYRVSQTNGISEVVQV